MNIRLHTRARIDLESAADWYAENAGRDIATDFIEAYFQAADLIREHPDIGRFHSART